MKKIYKRKVSQANFNKANQATRDVVDRAVKKVFKERAGTLLGDK